MFNFKQFLEDFNISNSGKNIGVDWINIDCVFCNDINGHLGINISDKNNLI